MRIGVDLGGTKIEAVVLAPDGSEAFRRRVATPRHDYAATIRAIVALVDEAETASGGRRPVGVGIPGMVSPATGLVKNANSTWLIGKPLDRDLAEALGRPVRLMNDANCFALSEAADGAGAGLPVVFGVIVGTGTGGGIVVDGRVLTGPNAIAGEWGHCPLPWPEAEDEPAPRCWCGKRGCIETYLSGPGLEREHERRSGARRSAEEVARLATAREAPARAALDLYIRRMARALAMVINVLDPDVIVLGGGMSNLAALYDEVPKLWGAHAFSDRITTPLRPPVHGDSSGVRGAARLWPE
ncbi:MAG: ROK family protein [Planctomycetes bacterium]|nr:ROK family protein [Planctomycetota bacterium]